MKISVQQLDTLAKAMFAPCGQVANLTPAQLRRAIEKGHAATSGQKFDAPKQSLISKAISDAACEFIAKFAMNGLPHEELGPVTKQAKGLLPGSNIPKRIKRLGPTPDFQYATGPCPFCGKVIEGTRMAGHKAACRYYSDTPPQMRLESESEGQRMVVVKCKCGALALPGDESCYSCKGS